MGKNAGIVYKYVKPAVGLQCFTNKGSTALFTSQLCLYGECLTVFCVYLVDNGIRTGLRAPVMYNYISTGFAEATGNARANALARTGNNDCPVGKIQKFLSSGYHNI